MNKTNKLILFISFTILIISLPDSFNLKLYDFYNRCGLASFNPELVTTT